MTTFFFSFFLVDEWIKIPLISGHHGPASKTPIKCISVACRRWPNIKCWPSSFVIFQGIWTSIAKKSYSFVIFQGWGDWASYPLSGSTHGWFMCCGKYFVYEKIFVLYRITYKDKREYIKFCVLIAHIYM